MIAGRALLVAFALLTAGGQPPAPGPARIAYRIDVPRSRFVVNTETEGMSSMFGHDHQIEVRSYTGEIDLVPGKPATASLALVVQADSLRALEERDEDISREIDVALRDHVLETRKYPTIAFSSGAVRATPRTDGTFDVSLAGDLGLHGVRRKVTVPLNLAFRGDTLRASGTVALRQHDFKISPYSFAGGTVTVADRLTLSFTIVATRVTETPPAIDAATQRR
jgi:polyisoprenoid-binding protein YceI